MKPTQEVMDISQYLYENLPHPVETVKMQKLLYYIKAWGLVFSPDNPPFTDRIEAWKNGPVVPVLYPLHGQSIFLDRWQTQAGNTHNISEQSQRICDFVLSLYQNFSGGELIALTKREKPWVDAWNQNCDEGAVIEDAAMMSFYRSRF